MLPTPFAPSSLPRCARTAAAAVVAACLIALSAAAQNPAPADPAEKRLRDIDTERSRIGYESVTLAEKTQGATEAQRAALMQQLKELQRRDTALQQEQAQLRRASGALPIGTPPPQPGGGIPQFPGGGAPKAPLVLPPIPGGGPQISTGSIPQLPGGNEPNAPLVLPPIPNGRPQISGGGLQVSGDDAALFSPAETLPAAKPAAPATVTPKVPAPRAPQAELTPATPTPKPPVPRVPEAELSPAAKHALCAEKFAAAQLLRDEAPRIRGKIGTIEDKLSRSALSVQEVNELADLKAERDYTASQISILEDSITSLGCDPATGKPKAPAPKKPAVDDLRAPTFDFIGTWQLSNGDGSRIGTMTITHAESSGTVDCNDAAGNTESGARTDRFIGGRIEFENNRAAFSHLFHAMGYNQWRALVANGPPRPAVFLGCVTGDTAEIWLHPETGNTPDCRLKIRGNVNDKKAAQIDGRSLTRTYSDDLPGNFRFWRMKQQ